MLTHLNPKRGGQGDGSVVDMCAASPDNWSSISLDPNDKRKEATDPESCPLTSVHPAIVSTHVHTDTRK